MDIYVSTYDFKTQIHINNLMKEIKTLFNLCFSQVKQDLFDALDASY